MALGTYTGGWRIIRTMGKGLVEIKSPQGMAAESSSAVIILLSAHFGYALSTTQVVTGSVLGSGVGKPGAEVRWGVAGRMATAWLITLPAAGLVGAVTYWVVHGIGGYAGAIVGFALLVAVAAAIYLQSRKTKVDHNNVNAEWKGDLTAGLDEEGKPGLAGAPFSNGEVSGCAAHPRGKESRHAMNHWFNYEASLKILIFGLLLGSGLPALFAIAVRVGSVRCRCPRFRRRRRRPQEPGADRHQLRVVRIDAGRGRRRRAVRRPRVHRGAHRSVHSRSQARVKSEFILNLRLTDRPAGEVDTL